MKFRKYWSKYQSNSSWYSGLMVWIIGVVLVLFGYKIICETQFKGELIVGAVFLFFGLILMFFGLIVMWYCILFGDKYEKKRKV